MASGVKVSDKVTEIFNEMKVVKNDSKQNDRIRLVVLEIKDAIEVTKVYRSADLADLNVYRVLVEQMPEEECRYFIYDCHYDTSDSPKEELVFVMWTPDASKCKLKMLYASSKSALRNAVKGVKHEIEMNDPTDYSLENFAEKLGKKVTAIEGQPI